MKFLHKFATYRKMIVDNKTVKQVSEKVRKDVVVAISVLNRLAVKYAKKSRVVCTLTKKKAIGRLRLKNLLFRLLDDFDAEHNNIFWFIEQNQENFSDKTYYEDCRKNIRIIIRAKNRLYKKNLMSNSFCSRIIRERQWQMRFHPTISLQTNL